MPTMPYLRSDGIQGIENTFENHWDRGTGGTGMERTLFGNFP